MTVISPSKFHPSGQGLRAVLHNVRVDLRPGPQLWHNSGLPGGREGKSEHVLVNSVLMTYADQLRPFPGQVTEYVSTGNSTVLLANGTEVVTEDIHTIRMEHPAFVFTERICIAFFTIEYGLRLFAAPRKLKFALKPLNLVFKNYYYKINLNK
jgi:hypothetical protein